MYTEIYPETDEERAYEAWHNIHHGKGRGECAICEGVRGHKKCPHKEPVKIKMWRCLKAKETIDEELKKPVEERRITQNGNIKK